MVTFFLQCHCTSITVMFQINIDYFIYKMHLKSIRCIVSHCAEYVFCYCTSPCWLAPTLVFHTTLSKSDILCSNAWSKDHFFFTSHIHYAAAMVPKKTASSQKQKQTKKSRVALSLAKKLKVIAKAEKGKLTASIARDMRLAPTPLFYTKLLASRKLLWQQLEEVPNMSPGSVIPILSRQRMCFIVWVEDCNQHSILSYISILGLWEGTHAVGQPLCGVWFRQSFKKLLLV